MIVAEWCACTTEQGWGGMFQVCLHCCGQVKRRVQGAESPQRVGGCRYRSVSVVQAASAGINGWTTAQADTRQNEMPTKGDALVDTIVNHALRSALVRGERHGRGRTAAQAFKADALCGCERHAGTA
jgi:hypothetical protein